MKCNAPLLIHSLTLDQLIFIKGIKLFYFFECHMIWQRWIAYSCLSRLHTHQESKNKWFRGESYKIWILFYLWVIQKSMESELIQRWSFLNLNLTSFFKFIHELGKNKKFRINFLTIFSHSTPFSEVQSP